MESYKAKTEYNKGRMIDDLQRIGLEADRLFKLVHSIPAEETAEHASRVNSLAEDIHRIRNDLLMVYDKNAKI